ncbi:MAG: MFS domain-containing histidine kinase [Neomegalonema sp.]|nr:MFS domain-containing histidine kinase [Neomegalonema sp.]
MTNSAARSAATPRRTLEKLRAAAAAAVQSAEFAEASEARPSGPLTKIEGRQAVAAGAPALFAPLAIALLSVTSAPSWTFLIAALSVAPLVAAIALNLIRPLRPTAYAIAFVPLACGAAWFAWRTGGPLSPAAPWVFAAIGGVALMGGRRGALFAALMAIGFGALYIAIGNPTSRLPYFRDVGTRDLTAMLSWSFAVFCLAATVWAALTAWLHALPPLRRPTIAARRALSLLADDTEVAALRVSPAGVVTQALGATDKAVKLPRDELRGIDIKTLAHPDDLPQLMAMIDAAHKAADLDGKSSKSGLASTRDQKGKEPPAPAPIAKPTGATVRLRSRSGAFEWVEASASPARAYPEPPNVGATRWDAMLVLRARWRGGDAVASDSRSTDAAFLAQVNSHLRTSIKSIHGYTEIMTNEIFGPLGADRYREYARLAHEDSGKLLSLVDELLDLAEIEAGRFVANAELIDPVPLLDGAVRNLSQTAERLGVAVSPDFPPNAPYVRVDRRALRRALSGLTLDGLRRAEIGDQVTLKLDVEDGAVRFSVIVATKAVPRSATPATDDGPKIAAPTHPSGAAAPNQPSPEEVASREAVRAAARLSRLVARSLVERMNGAILVAPDGEKATPERPLIASEAIFETPRSASAPVSSPTTPRLFAAKKVDPVGFAPDDEEAQLEAERAIVEAQEDEKRVQQPLFAKGVAEGRETPTDESAAAKQPDAADQPALKTAEKQEEIKEETKANDG